MTPELIGILALLGTVVALGVGLFGALKWFDDRMERRFEAVDRRFEAVDRRFEEFELRIDKRFDAVDVRFDAVDRRFERIEADISKLKEGQAKLEGMFEGVFERVPRAR